MRPDSVDLIASALYKGLLRHIIFGHRRGDMDQRHKRLVLEDLLYRRIGELQSHFGRYDMHALLVETLLLPPGMSEIQRPRSKLNTRGESIRSLLKLRDIPRRLHGEFIKIDDDMRQIFERHEISASNGAVVGMGTGAASKCATPGGPRSTNRDWYDMGNSDDGEFSRRIEELEADILAIVGLYIRLAAIAQDVREALAYLH